MRLINSSVTRLMFIFVYASPVVDSFTYLAVLHIVSKSHFSVGESLLKALAAKGHEVYVVSPFPQKQPIKNYYDIPLTITDGVDTSSYVLKDYNVRQLMASKRKFDAVICEVFVSDLLYGLSEHFRAPLIGLSTLGASPSDTYMVGSPSPPSYVSHHLLPLSDHMTFFERVLNWVTITYDKVFLELHYLYRQSILYEQYFPNSARDMYTVRKNAALVLLNSHVSLGYARPYMPNHIEVGGMHIDREPKPLPQDMQKFIQEAEHGVVYFSMGSTLKSKDLPAAKKAEFLAAFSKIKQRVLWKFEESTLPGKPSNVFIREWFPQADVLAHENVKVFVTHGGLLGITETIYHSTPIIGIPMFGDQFHNVVKAVAKGFAVKVDFETLTAQSLIKAIQLVINNETYTRRAEEMSARYRDQPMAPRDLAVFWVEHVARHKGAKYLHCAGLDLNFFQYHSIDVMIISCGVLFMCMYTTYHLFKHLWKLLGAFGSRTAAEKED